MKNKSKIRISITIMPNLDDLLEKQAKQAGLSKSSLIEEAVEQFFKNKLAEDAKMLAKTKFDDVPTADEWFLISPLWQ